MKNIDTDTSTNWDEIKQRLETDDKALKLFLAEFSVQITEYIESKKQAKARMRFFGFVALVCLAVALILMIVSDTHALHVSLGFVLGIGVGAFYGLWREWKEFTE